MFGGASLPRSVKRLLPSSVLSIAVAGLVTGLAGAQSSVGDPVGTQPRFSMEQVAISGPEDVERLEGLGLDVTHDVTETTATIALYSDAERALLEAHGYRSEVLSSDLAAKSAAEREAEAGAAATSLPSGRSTYRVYDDYLSEIDQLAEQNPAFVRKAVIGQSLEGRDIVGLEIATEVNREDDGRPVYVQMGLHHVREWPSGEFPMEFAIDLVEGFKGGDPRITALLQNARTFVLPVINPDGFIVSRGAAISPVGGGGALGIGIVAGSGEYKRKNCRPTDAAQAELPCAQRPANSGVDLNRNYGYYWGGPGAGTSLTAENYRGTDPFSEPETEAVHRFVSDIHPTVLITNHTFTENGWWLRQPGFNGSFFPQQPGGGAITPDEEALKELGDAMGDEGTDNPLLGATGWPSDLSWELGDITGATEDWNYFAQGTYGYTPEARGADFHGLYQSMVETEYVGDPAHPGEGVREAFLLAGDEAYDEDNHGVIEGSVPPGATLTLRKEFEAPRHPQNGGPPTPEVLETTLKGRADGTYEWHVMPSDRPQIPDSPLPAGDEQWTMSCRQSGQEAFTRSVEVGRGQSVTENWSGGACGAEPIENVPPTADFTHSPVAPEVGEQVNFTSTSTDPDGAIDPSETRWDLDDDGQFDDAVGLVASRSFATAGSHDVSVQVTDDDGATDTETKAIEVSEPANTPPTADFTFFPAQPSEGDDVTFTDASSDPDGELEGWAWDLDDDGDFDDALGSEVTRAFTEAGSYEISLEVSDDDGATATATKTVVVAEAEAQQPPSQQGSSQQGASAASGSCRGRVATIVGTTGDDLLKGTPGADVIQALAGADRVLGLGGDDLVCGGPGPDRIFGGRGADRLLGGRGADRIKGGPGRDECRGGRGIDRLHSCP